MEDADMAVKERSEFKAKVLAILSQGDYKEKRAAMVSQEHFFHLLSLFNEVGFHFS